LLDGSENAVTWTISDADGNYSFEDLPLNTYKVVSGTASAKGESAVSSSSTKSVVNVDLMLKSSQAYTDTEELAPAVIRLYPNPSTANVMLTSPENSKMYIFSAIGQLIMEQEVFEGLNSLNLSSIGKGVYLLKIGKNTTRLIMQ
jgi:hypothetical protein